MIKSDSTLDGTEASTTLLQQNYAIDLAGFIWDPRFSHFSLGVDLTESSLKDDELDQGTRGLGYRAQTNFFPGRRFPLTLYGRRSAVDATGGEALARVDRESDSWGARMALLGIRNQTLNLQFDRSSFDLLGPLPLKERRATGAASYSRRQENGELDFRYNYLNTGERVNGTDFTRNNFHLSERTRIGEITTLRINGQHTFSDARFASGETDELKIYSLAASMDFNPASGPDTLVGYNYHDNRGKFVDSVSHAVHTRSQFRMSQRWTSNIGVQASDLRSRSDTSDTEQQRAGVHGGVHYGRGWKRVSVSTGYGVGHSREWLSETPDRTSTSQSANVGGQFQLSPRSDLGGSVSYRISESDQTGTAASMDELRASLRWNLRLGGDWKMSTALTRRLTVRETLTLGTQESDEISLNSNLNHPVAGFSLSWSHVEGISELLPDPASSTPFTPGPDIVSESDTLSLMAHWRPTPFLRASMLARGEYRDFSTFTEKEEYLTFQPSMQYTRNTWSVSSTYTHYQRQNGLDFVSDAWGLTIGKRFY